MVKVAIDWRWLADDVGLKELIVSEVESGLDGRGGFEGFMMVGTFGVLHAAKV